MDLIHYFGISVLFNVGVAAVGLMQNRENKALADALHYSQIECEALASANKTLTDKNTELTNDLRDARNECDELTDENTSYCCTLMALGISADELVTDTQESILIPEFDTEVEEMYGVAVKNRL